MTQDETAILVRLAEDTGYALATFEAFRSPTGVTSEVLDEAMRRLSQVRSLITALLTDNSTLLGLTKEGL